MVKLSVNLNKVALIRNSRGANYPNLVKVALDIESYGADGITIHPRPDQRHAKYEDIYELKEVLKTELNIEGNPNDLFLDHVLKASPAQCTLVPDAAHALTSDAGWDTILHRAYLQDVIGRLSEKGIRVSVFINAIPEMVDGAKECGADRVEMYTGPYALDFERNREEAIRPFIETAQRAVEVGVGLNAGHDLNLNNLRYFAASIPGLLEVSIGHALVSDALYLGFPQTIAEYRQRLTF